MDGDTPRNGDHLTTALVLSGGGARGAYEVGVISYLEEELTRELGRPLPLDIICGTSIGALNACAVAAMVNDRAGRAARLVDIWRSLQPDHVLSFGVFDALRLLRESIGTHHGPHQRHEEAHAGLVNTKSLQELLLGKIPWLQIGRNLRDGTLQALSIAATHVGSGRTVAFIQHQNGPLPTWTLDPNFIAVRARISARHALASAAIPLIFPPVRIGRELYVDGGLRLNVPLSPALRLGAQRLIILSMRPTPYEELRLATEEAKTQAGEEVFPSAPFLAGKMLNAVLQESIEQDLDRLERINAILEAGASAFGPTFAPTINEALQAHGHLPLRQIRTVLLRPSHDIGALAAEYMATEFKSRFGLASRTLQVLAERESTKSADLVSYLLFDGGFADWLIDLGRRDARARHDAWLRFFSEEPQTAWERLYGTASATARSPSRD